jgi:hypothetical protein
LPHHDIDKLDGGMCHKHAAILVKDFRVRLFLEYGKRLCPALSLYPVRQHVVVVVDGAGIEEEFFFPPVTADDVVSGFAVQVGLISGNEVLKFSADCRKAIFTFRSVCVLGQLGFGGDGIIQRV